MMELAAVRTAVTGLALAIMLSGPAVAAAQQAGLQGIVTSSSTSSPLEGVVVALEVGGEQVYSALTDRNGFYQIGGVAAGVYTLRARLIGQLAHEQLVRFGAGERLRVNFRMAPDPVVLEGIVVATERGAAVRDLGRQLVTPGQIRLVPIPAGTGDLATYLQTLPGVTTTGDRGGQLFVRGGTASENLVLVDGIPIYQPFHIIGFFSVFPEDLVSSVDFYAGGFGARYHDRTSAVIDVRLRDGHPSERRVVASVSPFIAEVLAEGPAGESVSWLASARRSLVEETSNALMGGTQPITFESQLLKFTVREADDRRCSVLGLRTADRGRLDPEEKQSRVEWRNLLVGGRCVMQFGTSLRQLEASFSYTSAENVAASRGSSGFHSSISRLQHDAHVTTMIGSIPLHAGYHAYVELMQYDLAELFSVQGDDADISATGAYVEAELPLGRRIEARPGLVFTVAPRLGILPRLRASWQPSDRSSGKLQGAFGLYRQDVLGTTDMRDVGSVFTAWMTPRNDLPLRALHAILGWQQPLGGGLRWSLEGYYKRLEDIPVPVWRGVIQFTTQLSRADGDVYGADARVEYSSPRFHGFLGYGYSWTQYQAAQAQFSTWFGQPVQRYHPPHDRRHQGNAVATLDLSAVKASARWQFGTGLPYTRPMGFDEAFDFSDDLHDVRSHTGASRLILDRPFSARMPVVHRLDLSIEREFDVPLGKLIVQAGAINAYNQRNLFYYDLYTGRRVDQLPLAPYAAVTLRTN